MSKAIKITSANYLFDYKIGFEFSNGKKTVIDFGEFILNHKNPFITPFKNLDKFKKFKIHFDRNIVWGKNKEMGFPFETIYKGGIIPAPDKNKIKKIIVSYFGEEKAKKMFADII